MPQSVRLSRRRHLLAQTARVGRRHLGWRGLQLFAAATVAVVGMVLVTGREPVPVTDAVAFAFTLVVLTVGYRLVVPAIDYWYLRCAVAMDTALGWDCPDVVLLWVGNHAERNVAVHTDPTLCLDVAIDCYATVADRGTQFTGHAAAALETLLLHGPRDTHFNLRYWSVVEDDMTRVGRKAIIGA